MPGDWRFSAVLLNNAGQQARPTVWSDTAWGPDDGRAYEADELVAAGLPSTITVTSEPPIGAPALATATAVSAGHAHSCALLADTTVNCWGRNMQGQLGDETTAGHWMPVAVSGLTGVTAISAGYGHSCALLADTTLGCWGDNGNGQLGDGTGLQSLTPVVVVEG